MNPYDPYNKMQMWFIDLNKIRNKHNTSLVLQANKSDNTVIVAEEADNMAEQLWEFYFMLVSSSFVPTIHNFLLLKNSLISIIIPYRYS